MNMPNYPPVNPLPDRLFHVEVKTPKGWTPISVFSFPGNVVAAPNKKAALGLLKDTADFRKIPLNRFRIVEWVKPAPVQKSRLAHWKAEAIKARERLAFIVAKDMNEMDEFIKERDQWKARALAVEQLLLRSLRCEFGNPNDGSCPWWAAYIKRGTLPKLVRVIPREKPRKGWGFSPDWVCEHCLKKNKHYKLESDPIGKAGT